MSKGAFAFVLHSHMPYARLAGRWPHGEEWIHEAATETYIPLLNKLYQLREEGVPYCLTIGLTPILCEQLADPDILHNLELYLQEKIAIAEQDIEYYQGFDTETEQHLYLLAKWYKDWYENILTLFTEQFNRDLIGTFRKLQDDGYIEIVSSAATHAYLPLLSRDSSIHAQLQTGIASYERFFGRKPTAIWLPECAYRPAYLTNDGKERAGLEHFLATYNIKVFFTETHAITGGQPVGVATGEIVGAYREIIRRYVVPMEERISQREKTTYQAYYLKDSMDSETHSRTNVAVIGRNNQTGEQVWNADWGYPGDFDYREFHRKSSRSGLQYWRVTGDGVELGDKELYQPQWATYKVEQHAEHFAHLVGDLLRQYQQATGRNGLIASNYDTELFGHWWFEGVDWLGEVIKHIATSSDVEMVTASQYVADNAPQETIQIPECSWGAGGTHFTWDNGETRWMWEPIYESEIRMEKLVATFPNPNEDEDFVLKQCAREVLLLQSSDWQFLVTTGQAREYASQRFTEHYKRFNRLALSLENGQVDREFAETCWELDKVFPDIHYTWFKE